MKPGAPYEKNADHEKEFTAPELEVLLKSVFGRVRMHGLRYVAWHRFFRRLKKWGLEDFGFVKDHFSRVTTDDFCFSEKDPRRSIDLLAVCTK